MFFSESNYCEKFFFILQENEPPHDACFERKKPLKNPLEWVKKMSEEKLPHWIEENKRPKSYMWVCSECGRTAYDMPMYQKKRYVKICSLAYCPHCGAKMVGEQEVMDKE